jgi:hypothetical protein
MTAAGTGDPSISRCLWDDADGMMKTSSTRICDQSRIVRSGGLESMHITERRIVHRPKSEASPRLAQFVAERRVGRGSLDIVLLLPIEMRAPMTLPIERRGIASVYSLQSASDPSPTYSVSWSSNEGWSLPEFAGALAVERVLLPNCFGLVLCGYYQPPLARTHPRFDFEAELRVAHRLTGELLRSVADFIENPHTLRARDLDRRKKHPPSIVPALI